MWAGRMTLAGIAMTGECILSNWRNRFVVFLPIGRHLLKVVPFKETNTPRHK